MAQHNRDFESQSSLPTLLVRAGACVCTLPTSFVVETMRPLLIEPISDMPRFLLGLSVIRGVATPVIALNILIGIDQIRKPNRFISLRISERRVALAVEEVLGVYDLKDRIFQDLPPLFQTGHSDLISSVGVLDKQLLLVLEATRLVPTEMWRALLNDEVAAS